MKHCSIPIMAIALALLGCQNPVGAPSANAGLATVTLSSGTVTPPFDPAISEYTVRVPNGTASITIAGIPADPGATLGGDNAKGVGLSVGANTLSVHVTAKDGVSARDYKFTVLRWGTDINSASIGELKYVPAGRFQRNGNPLNISVVSPFRMAAKEITRAQFLAVMGTDPSDPTAVTSQNDPVMRISYFLAITYCNKLSLLEGLTPVYGVSTVSDWAALPYASVPTSGVRAWEDVTVDLSASGYRLPTEMEWIWAAMGAPVDGQGSQANATGYGKGFAGSDGTNSLADYAVYGAGKAKPVGSKLPNELGIYDLSGNAWEWCGDKYEAWPAGTLVDYHGAASGYKSAFRGGCFSNADYNCALTVRIDCGMSGNYRDLGFRVVRRY